MSSDVHSSLVPLLNHDGTNYTTWATRMEMLLIRERLWSIVAERRLRPQPLSAPGPATHSGYDTIDDEVTKWDDDAERAMCMIFLHLDEHAEKHIQTLRDPVAIWKKLKDIYEMRGFSARFYLWQKLFTLRHADYRHHGDNAMDMYIDAFRTYCLQLRGLGAEISSEIEASMLLNGLDNTFDGFLIATTQAFRQQSDAEINVEQLIMQLTASDEARRRTEALRIVYAAPAEAGDTGFGMAGLAAARGRRGGRDAALAEAGDTGFGMTALTAARGRRGGRERRGREERRGGGRDRDRPQCDYCSRSGHSPDECWDLHPELKVQADLQRKRLKRSAQAAKLAAADMEMSSRDAQYTDVLRRDRDRDVYVKQEGSRSPGLA